MKKIFFVFYLFLVIRQLHAQNIEKVKINDVVHYIDTTTQPVIINFWATWCTPCIHELNYFENEIKAVAGNRVKIILISVDYADDYPKTIAKFVKQHGYSATIWWLNETNAADFCPKIDRTWNGNIPATLMMNPITKYRQFYNRQLTAPQIPLAVQEMLNGGH
ncbi:MAG: redoxin domain-containing protein [Hydrotalea flava]|uniref:TlpA disulfide reductase family protein n=1 Tax=Hydrotalea TaxID=1004300 RepID=UPI000941F8AE|nr:MULTISPECIES: TlpA disulfide reductase family protein [Hydrotalea]NIM34404.1 redoxin domain-containing protein [Hydrotalea flava]NIM37230.1 redoxin domain-containing protein [Hydrotalea flava]NIN02423.1 redoxin domain-containing protein [Hydrotalea flava]NIN14075.1 redoxin domain-containing protein [Hydrotalea flava]NIO93156.1 redoxin domain-containing protein [Hydrotalea flava]